MLELVLDIGADALRDTLYLVPFLLVTYLLLETLEHKAGAHTERLVQKAGHFGPAVAAVLGAVPQCGFSAAGAALFSSRAITLGTLFAAVYFRTGNLWVTVFLHSAMDIAAMLIGGLYGTTSVAESVSGYDASRLLSVVVYLIPTVFLLRKKKLPEVQLYWGGIVKN